MDGCAYLEGVLHSYKERETDCLQDALLIQSVFNLLQLHHLGGRGHVYQ